MRRMIASCCQSFSPKMATSGRTWLNNLATTVATPSKCPGPRRAAIVGAEFGHLDMRGMAARIHGRDIGRP